MHKRYSASSVSYTHLDVYKRQIISSGSVRDEGTSRSYVDLSYPAVPDPFLMMHCIESAEEFNFPHHVGITRSHESFYSKKEISLEPYWQEMGILGDDMETSALFTEMCIRDRYQLLYLLNLLHM